MDHNNIECVVCFNIVQSDEVQKLSCDHTFCIDCLSKIHYDHQKNILPCPLCRCNGFSDIRCLICHTTLHEPCIECSTSSDHKECKVHIGSCQHRFHTHCIKEWVDIGKKRGILKPPIPSCQECLIGL